MQQCPICKENIAKVDLISLEKNTCICPRCGKYTINSAQQLALTNDSTYDEYKHLLSAWMSRKTQSGTYKFAASSNNIDQIIQEVKTFPLPKSVPEKKHAFILELANLVEKSNGNYNQYYTIPMHNFIPLLACKDFNQVKSIAVLLGDDNLIKVAPNSPHLTLQCSLTSKGWEQIEKRRQSQSSSNTAFVAMWFDDVTENFREQTRQAVIQAGYKPVFADEEQHNGYIMDKVIVSIKNAKFVIADLTCYSENSDDKDKPKNGVRGGVYFEAGFAKGLGKEVILTCKDARECRARIHFDTQQINTIFWTENKDGQLLAYKKNFVDELKFRIQATIGQGPIAVSESSD